MSISSPQYMPGFALSRDVTLKAEPLGFDVALSMIKLRGFGGPSRYWGFNHESFTLMAGLAAVTTRIKLFASVAVLSIPPALIARMATTIDSIAPEECVADRHESPHFANLHDMAVKYADVMPVAEIPDAVPQMQG